MIVRAGRAQMGRHYLRRYGFINYDFWSNGCIALGIERRVIRRFWERMWVSSTDRESAMCRLHGRGLPCRGHASGSGSSSCCLPPVLDARLPPWPPLLPWTEFWRDWGFSHDLNSPTISLFWGEVREGLTAPGCSSLAPSTRIMEAQCTSSASNDVEGTDTSGHWGLPAKEQCASPWPTLPHLKQ